MVRKKVKKTKAYLSYCGIINVVHVYTVNKHEKQKKNNIFVNMMFDSNEGEIFIFHVFVL